MALDALNMYCMYIPIHACSRHSTPVNVEVVKEKMSYTSTPISEEESSDQAVADCTLDHCSYCDNGFLFLFLTAEE